MTRHCRPTKPFPVLLVITRIMDFRTENQSLMESNRKPEHAIRSTFSTAHISTAVLGWPSAEFGKAGGRAGAESSGNGTYLERSRRPTECGCDLSQRLRQGVRPRADHLRKSGEGDFIFRAHYCQCEFAL